MVRLWNVPLGINRQPAAKCESRSDQLQRQLTPIAILVPFDKIRDRRQKLAHLQIAATAQFAGDIFGTSSDQPSAVLTRIGLLYERQGRRRAELKTSRSGTSVADSVVLKDTCNNSG
jgi:hypothetical protein